jgi:hypothetical protein
MTADVARSDGRRVGPARRGAIGDELERAAADGGDESEAAVTPLELFFDLGLRLRTPGSAREAPPLLLTCDLSVTYLPIRDR